MRNVIKMMWKIQCPGLFEAPLPLFWRGRRRERSSGEVKTPNIFIFANL
jgi:hypothetical protein